MYKLKPFGILRQSDNALIPVDQSNRDYQEYLQWFDAGNTPGPADVEIIDTTVDPLQIREALTQKAWRNQFEAAVTSAGKTMQDWWEYTPHFRRYHPNIIDIFTKINKTSAQIDEVFALAATLSP